MVKMLQRILVEFDGGVAALIIVVLWLMWPPSRCFPLSPPWIRIRSEFVVHASTPPLTSQTNDTWAEVWWRDREAFTRVPLKKMPHSRVSLKSWSSPTCPRSNFSFSSRHSVGIMLGFGCLAALTCGTGLEKYPPCPLGH